MNKLIIILVINAFISILCKNHRSKYNHPHTKCLTLRFKE